MNTDLKNYLVVTAGYWAFTLTDGAIRMLVVLYFHMLGYSPFEVAMLFLFYEFFGIVTNLVGGWMAARLGLNVTMHLGMAMQVVALLMLTVPDALLSVAYVMAAQALSGIAKDLNKMSAKASVKTLVSSGTDTNSKLFKWVAILTGSKNALKGVGFFLGALLLEIAGFRVALAILAGGLFIILVITWIMLPNEIGKAKAKPKFTQVFSNIAAINWLSAARFFLFGSRDVWFVVALPVFFYEVLHWDFMKIGGFMALWVIGYGIVQASAPMILKGHHPTGRTALWLALMLAAIPAAIALAMSSSFSPFNADNLSNVTWIVVIGLLVFGVAFAINSAVHSYLILAYSDNDKVSMNVGFYYMANAGGRLAGTVLSGLVYQSYGLVGCLWISAAFVLMAAILSLGLPAKAELE
ncbi:organoarsenical effux MFS transporter ArsJ [Cocleimonas flava]|uniref:MFS transporter n=1 Tax=Cocleimonas flava TaxID=634765 RepID=A0A4R1FD01_9GAMM|nr:organoarsenical effux MFS transporter ArsJ [Cocleimonas flava]TCJ88701.1 MFS transporter [Cocleimonas flava]